VGAGAVTGDCGAEYAAAAPITAPAMAGATEEELGCCPEYAGFCGF
jgi:hypothetical protein